MRIDIINTGAELMLGRVLNTHQQWLCRALTDNGYFVARQVAVDDSTDAIREAANDALAKADLIIITGGLGPTSDDPNTGGDRRVSTTAPEAHSHSMTPHPTPSKGSIADSATKPGTAEPKSAPGFLMNYRG